LWDWARFLYSLTGFTAGNARFFIGLYQFHWLELLRVNAGITMVSFTLAFPLSRAMDSLTLGESTALSLGLSLAPVRSMLIFSLTLATGKAVAQTGLIAFVGLAAPHLVRSLVKTKHNWVVFLSVLIGVALMLSADLMVRHLLAPQELLVGVLMAVLGGSYLLWHLYSNQTMRSAR
jgi:iron complex transport system permease protein